MNWVFSWMVKGLEVTWLEYWWQQSLGKRYGERPPWMDKEKWTCVCPSAYQRVTSAEKDFSKQVDKMICSGYLSLFPIHPCYCPLGLWTHWLWWQGWRSGLGSTTWTSLQGQGGYSHCCVPTLRPTPSLQYSIIPQSDQSATWWHVDYTGDGDKLFHQTLI